MTETGVRLRLPWLLILLLGCAPDFSLPVEEEDGGVLLSSWTHGDAMLSVGGKMDGSGGLLVRADADGWCKDTSISDRPLWWIHGSGDRWFAVGEEGLILRGEGGEVVDESIVSDLTFFGVWDEGDRVWAVGGTPRANVPRGEVWLRESGVWTLFADGFPGPLFKVWEDVVVGRGGAWRIVGSGVEDLSPPDEPNLLTVRGRGEELFAVGGVTAPQLWQHDGAWNAVDVDPYCANLPLNGVWTDEGEDVWVAGAFGAAAGWDGDAWTCPDSSMTQDDFHAVWKWDDAMWFVGGNLTSSQTSHFSIGRYGQGTVDIAIDACP